jgi:FecR protein
MFDSNMRLRTTAIAVMLALSFCAVPSLVRAEAVVGKITQVSGKAQVKRGSASLDAVAAMPVELHDQLKTATPGELTVQMLDNSILTVNESSLLAIDESVVSAGVRKTDVGLISGSVQSLVTSVARAAAPTFKVKTPNAIAGVRGTNFICRYKTGTARAGFPNCFEFTDCATVEGTVVVTNNPPRPGVEVKVKAGERTTVACLAAPLAATAGGIGALSAPAAGAGSGLGPAAIVGIGVGSAAVIGGTVAGVIEGTSGGGSGGTVVTVSPAQ